MADPLSVIASVLTLVGAGSQVAKSFKKILKLKDAPEVVFALQNEVSDCCCVLEDIQSTLERCAREDFLPQASLVRFIERTKETILAVQSLIYYDLFVVDSKNTHIRMDKSRWLRAEPKIQGLQMRMRSNRSDLILGLHILTSSFGIEALSQNRQIILHNNDVDSTFRQIRSSLAQQSRRMDVIPMRAPRTSEPLLDCSANLSDDPSIASECAEIVPNSTLISQTSLSQVNAPHVIQVISTKHCKLDCACICHQNTCTRTPRFLDRVLGSLFLGYQAAPWFAQPCDDPFCHSSTMRLSYIYAFPRWFLNRILQACLSYSRVQGPEFLLRVLRVRAMDDVPFKFITSRYPFETMLGNVKGAIENAEASILDVDQRGFTLLHVNKHALLCENFELVEYLLEEGADPFIDGDGFTPYFLAWIKILNKPGSPRALKLSKLFDQSRLYSFGFSRLHRAYLGLSGDDFLTILDSIDRTDLDKEDCSSRTTLSWAAIRGDRDAMYRLLACGADPNISKDGFVPLHDVAQLSAGEDCIGRLIKANALVDIRDHHGNVPHLKYHLLDNQTFKSISLSLNDANAAKDRTPLMLAARKNYSENVKALLWNGADINLIDSHKFSAIDHAIKGNSHEALVALLQGPRPNVSLFELDIGSLKLIAHQADEQILQILINYAENFKFDPNRSKEMLAWVLCCAEHRREANENSQADLYDEKSPKELENPAEWFSLFVQLGSRIYRLELGKIRDEGISESSSGEDNESEDGASRSDSEHNDNGNRSGSDEEQWHYAREEQE